MITDEEIQKERFKKFVVELNKIKNCFVLLPDTNSYKYKIAANITSKMLDMKKVSQFLQKKYNNLDVLKLVNVDVTKDIEDPQINVVLERYYSYSIQYKVHLTSPLYKYKDSVAEELTDTNLERVAKNLIRRAEKLYARTVADQLDAKQLMETNAKRKEKLKEIFPNAAYYAETYVSILGIPQKTNSNGSYTPAVKLDITPSYELSKNITPSKYKINYMPFLSKAKLDRILEVIAEEEQ